MDNIGWEGISALGTILSAFIALSIALFSYYQNENRYKKNLKKEAVEKILIPIREKLISFKRYKWDSYGSRNWWDDIEIYRENFFLLYFNLDDNIRKSLEDFNKNFIKIINLRGQIESNLAQRIEIKFKEFIINNKFSDKKYINELKEEDIINAHWNYSIGGNSKSVTLYSLVILNKNLSDYKDERKEDLNLPNLNEDFINFSIHCPSRKINISLDFKRSNELISCINSFVLDSEDIKEYIEKWIIINQDSLKLLKNIDSYLINES